MEAIDVGAWMGEPQMLGDLPTVWNPHPWSQIIREYRSDTGEVVTPEVALTHTPLWHGLLLLGGDAGSLDIQLKERVSEDQIRDNRTHIAYKQASVRPNPLMCPANFWEMHVPRAILWGNAISEVKRTRTGMLLPVDRGGGLHPLNPETTKQFFDDGGKLWIQTQDLSPTHQWLPPRFIDPDDTFHLASLTTDGFWGRSLAVVARNRIANGLGIEKQHNRFMRNGMQPDWFLAYPTALDGEAQTAVETKLQEYRGLENVGKSLVLDQDVKAHQLGMSFEHAQFVELAKLDIQMVASLLGIPAVMLNAMDKMTFNNTEESERWYINRTLRRWLNKIAQELHAKLLTEREQDRFKFEHNLDPMLQGRLKERWEAYSIAIASRGMNPNEARAKEGMNPYEGGEEFFNPNTTPGQVPGEDTEDETEDTDEPEDQARAAALLRRLMAKEDDRVATAAMQSKNFVGWCQEYYGGEMLKELFDLTPKVAEDYCEAQRKYWTRASGAVNTQKQLLELVKAQKPLSRNRVAGLLTEEFANSNGSAS